MKDEWTKREQRRRRHHTLFTRRRVLRWSACTAAIILVALICLLFPFRSLLPAYKIPARAEGELRLHFLNMGQGDCTVVEFPEGELLVIDGGDGSWAYGNRLIRYIKGFGSKEISLLVTHADHDHYGGMIPLLRYFDIRRIYLPILAEEAGGYEKLTDAVAENGCEQLTISRYGVIEGSGGAYLVCLNPYSMSETDINDASTVLFLHYEGVNVVLAADISESRERLLAREYALDEHLFDSGEYAVPLAQTHILKVSHHGSAYASSSEWLSLLGAETAVISCGQGNSYGHPTQEALARLAGSQIFRTDELGDIMITIRAGGYHVETHYLS